MYSAVLVLHSYWRWLVLCSLVLATSRAYSGWMLGKSYTPKENAIRHWAATIAHVQLILGIGLYFISPLIHYFLADYKVAVHQREIRFFGMEHSLMMFLAIFIVTLGSMKAKRKITDKEKYKTIAIWFSIALLIILINIPWPFSPFAGRPYFRVL